MRSGGAATWGLSHPASGCTSPKVQARAQATKRKRCQPRRRRGLEARNVAAERRVRSRPGRGSPPPPLRWCQPRRSPAVPHLEWEKPRKSKLLRVSCDCSPRSPLQWLAPTPFVRVVDNSSCHGSSDYAPYNEIKKRNWLRALGTYFGKNC